VSENEKEIKFFINLPGLKREDVKIDVDEEHRLLTVFREESNSPFASQRGFGHH